MEGIVKSRWRKPAPGAESTSIWLNMPAAKELLGT